VESSRAARTIYEALNGLKRIAGSVTGGSKKERKRLSTFQARSTAAAASSATGAAHGSSDRREGDEEMRDCKEIYVSSRYPGVPYQSKTATSERDRGQSVTEVSIAGVQGHGSEWAAFETGTTFSQPRALSEYTEHGDLESISEESRSTGSTYEDAGQGLYDKKVLVKRSRGYAPAETGRGGTEKYKTEVSTTTVKQDVNQY